jgi:hypothetical protein
LALEEGLILDRIHGIVMGGLRVLKVVMDDFCPLFRRLRIAALIFGGSRSFRVHGGRCVLVGGLGPDASHLLGKVFWVMLV